MGRITRRRGARPRSTASLGRLRHRALFYGRCIGPARLRLHDEHNRRGARYASPYANRLSAPGVTGLVDSSPFPGSPLLDFVENAIIAFVRTAVLPFGNQIAAIVGGSQGGHMALRLAASQESWVGNVIAWSPMGVCESEETLAGFSVPHLWLTGPNLWSRAIAQEVAAPASPDSRQDFFSTVWDQPTFAPNVAEGLAIGTAVAAALAETAAIGAIP